MQAVNTAKDTLIPDPSGNAKLDFFEKIAILGIKYIDCSCFGGPVNFGKIILLTLPFVAHTLLPADADDDEAFWDDNWRTGQASSSIPEILPDLESYSTLPDDSSHLLSAIKPQHSAEQIEPVALAQFEIDVPSQEPMHSTDSKKLTRSNTDSGKRVYMQYMKNNTHQTAVAFLDEFYVCKTCGYGTDKKSRFDDHRIAHNKPERYMCGISGCFFIADNVQVLTEHVRDRHRHS